MRFWFVFFTHIKVQGDVAPVFHISLARPVLSVLIPEREDSPFIHTKVCCSKPQQSPALSAESTSSLVHLTVDEGRCTLSLPPLSSGQNKWHCPWPMIWPVTVTSLKDCSERCHSKKWKLRKRERGGSEKKSSELSALPFAVPSPPSTSLFILPSFVSGSAGACQAIVELKYWCGVSKHGVSLLCFQN